MIDRAGAAPTLGIPTPVGDEQKSLYSSASRKLQVHKWSCSLTKSISSFGDFNNRCSTVTY